MAKLNQEQAASINAQLQTIYNGLGALKSPAPTGASAPAAPTPSTVSGSGGTTRNESLLTALTDRLTRQGDGIVSSSSSGIQDSINEAIASTQESGALNRQALQSEREREAGYAGDRAEAQYRTALEGRTGFATMTYGLRELTETTEKSIRDLDKRYQESILANDAATASRVAELRMQKLEFQQEAEQNYINNLFNVAQLASQEYQFGAQMEQSDRQFKDQFNLDVFQFEAGQNLDRDRLAQDAEQFKLRLDQDKTIADRAYALDLARYGAANKQSSLAKSEVRDLALHTIRTAANGGIVDESGQPINVNDRAVMVGVVRTQLDNAGIGKDLTDKEFLDIVYSSYGDYESERKSAPAAPATDSPQSNLQYYSQRGIDVASKLPPYRQIGELFKWLNAPAGGATLW